MGQHVQLTPSPLFIPPLSPSVTVSPPYKPFAPPFYPNETPPFFPFNSYRPQHHAKCKNIATNVLMLVIILLFTTPSAFLAGVNTLTGSPNGSIRKGISQLIAQASHSSPALSALLLYIPSMLLVGVNMLLLLIIYYSIRFGENMVCVSLQVYILTELPFPILYSFFNFVCFHFTPTAFRFEAPNPRLTLLLYCILT